MKTLKPRHFYFLSLGLVAASLAFVSSCAPGVSNEIEAHTTVLSAAAVVGSSATPEVKAEKLAVIADQLFSSGALAQALDVTDVALTFDQTNLRAGLTSALAKPLVTLRGVILRAAPLALKNADAARQNSYYSALGVRQVYAMGAEKSAGGFESWLTNTDMLDPAALAYVNRYNSSVDFKTNLLAKVQDVEKKSPGFAFNTESQLQTVFDRAITDFEQLRTFVKARKNESIVITATTILIPDLIQRYASQCIVNESDKLVYELTCPADEQRNHVRLNRADFELIGDVASFYEASFIVGASYGIEPLASLSFAYYPKAIVEAYLKLPGVGKLRAQQRLGLLNAMSLDLAGGLNWAQANQSTLCARNVSDPSNRPGFIFNTGFCLGGGFSEIVSMLSAISRGDAFQTSLNGLRTNMKPSAFFASPIADVKSLSPIFNEDGSLSSVSDGTFGGAFPNGDFNQILNRMNSGAQ